MPRGLPEGSHTTVAVLRVLSFLTQRRAAGRGPRANVPRGLEEVPARADAVRERRESVRGRGESVPKRCDEVPKRCDAVPKRADAVPKRADAVPKRVDAVPKRVDEVPFRVRKARGTEGGSPASRVFTSIPGIRACRAVTRARL
jgi:hypothetical protein